MLSPVDVVGWVTTSRRGACGLIEIRVAKGEFDGDIQGVGADVSAQHFRRSVAGDFHYIIYFHAGKIHQGCTGATRGVRSDELVFGDLAADGTSPLNRPDFHWIDDAGQAGNFFDVAVQF